MTSRTNCLDCGIDTLPIEHDRDAEFYLVHDHVWAASGTTHGHLCVGCLEARLGRQLTLLDFVDCPVNDLRISRVRYAWSWRTPRLVERLTTLNAVERTRP